MMQSSTVTVHHRSALSPTAQRLLQEFSLRYGVVSATLTKLHASTAIK